MEQRLKQRLVGAGVLVLVVVWLVPELLESDDPPPPKSEEMEEVTDEFSSRIVPLEEEDISVAEPEADSADVESDVPASESDSEIEQTVSEPAPETAVAVEDEISEEVVTVTALVEDPVDQELQPLPVPRPKPRGSLAQNNGERLGLTVWAIQLGSFGNSENAIGLRDRLREKGYTAFVQTAYNNDGVVNRVFVGPELYREEAEAIRTRLHSETTLDGLVVRYPGG